MQKSIVESDAERQFTPEARDTHVDSVAQYSVLLVEDSPTDAEFIMQALGNADEIRFNLQHVPDLSTAVGAIPGGDFDVVLLDLGLPDAEGMDAVRTVCGNHPDVPVVVLTGNSSDEAAIRAIEIGAQDFLVKHLPFPSGSRLAKTLQYAIARRNTLPNTRSHYVRTGTASVARPREKAPANPESELEAVKARLQMLTLQETDTLDPMEERRLIKIELTEFIRALEAHFTREEITCLAKKEMLPEALGHSVTDLLEQHVSLLEKFRRVFMNTGEWQLQDLKRETLAAMCCFIEHEIQENTLLDYIERL